MSGSVPANRVLVSRGVVIYGTHKDEGDRSAILEQER